MSPTYVVAPVIPFQPEELHRQVRELEQVYGQIPALDVHLNGRLAVAMAIVAATGSFLEGALHAVLRERLGDKVKDGVILDDLLKTMRSIESKLRYLKDRAIPLGGNWSVADDQVSRFVENKLPGKTRGLVDLRNRVGHGAPVEQADLHLNDVKFFRQTTCAYLERVYASFGQQKPGWLGT